MEPLISICIPTYNGAKHLRECLDSVITQTFKDFEILVVDDCSSDDTLSIAREYAERDNRIRIKQNERNLGLVNNWNHCVELASGEWVKFVFQDDYMHETCIEKLIGNVDPETSIICCRRKFCFGEDIEPRIRMCYLSLLTLDALFPNKTKISPVEFCNAVIERYNINFIGEPSNIMFRKNMFFQLGKFNPHLISLCDYEYWIRVAINRGLSYIPEALTTFRVHKLGTTALDREKRIYRMCILDPLLILHEFCFNHLYEPLRAVAAKQEPPIDLINLLAYKTREAVNLAGRSDVLGNDSSGKKMEEWDNIVRYYPNLGILSNKIFVHSKTLKQLLKILKLQ
jgi:glycosyltransferase involved in cell wall biosynthesis